MDIRVTIDQNDLNKVKSMLSGIENGADKALTRSINKTTVNSQTYMVKKTGAHFNVKAARIKKDFDIKKATYSKTSASVDVTSEPIGLINFGGKQLKKNKGVSVKVLKKGPREKLGSGFFVKVKKNLHIGERTYEHRGQKPVRPIAYAKLPKMYKKFKVKYGPRLNSYLERPDVRADVEEHAAERMSVNLLHEADAILNRYA